MPTVPGATQAEQPAAGVAAIVEVGHLLYEGRIEVADALHHGAGTSATFPFIVLQGRGASPGCTSTLFNGRQR